MKKLLLFFVCVLVTIGAKAGTSTGTMQSDWATVDVTITDDPSLESFKGTNPTGAVDDFKLFGYTEFCKVTFNGTGINQAGLTKVFNAMTNSKLVTVDLSGCPIEGDITSLSSKIEKMLFPAGMEMPAVLKSCLNLKYAYSADDSSTEGVLINLYVGTVTSLDEITELNGVTLDANTVVNLTGDESEIIKQALVEKGVSEDNIMIPVLIDKTTITTTAENLETYVAEYIAENGDLSTLEKLVITDGEITKSLFDYMATTLKDLKKVDLTNATLSDRTRLADGTTVNWEEFVLPTGTKISPNFKCYPNLKYAMAGGFNKIWLVSQRGKEGATDAFSSIIKLIPQEIKNKPAADRIGVAFVGEVTVDDVKSVAGSDTPLANARIWHFDAATGLKKEDFKDLALATQGNNDNPTGFVLPRGMSLDDAWKTVSESGQGWKIGNIYVLSEDGGTLSVLINKTETFDIARFTVANTEMAILKSGGANVKVDANIINALKGTKRAESVDLSGMNFTDNSDDILKNVTEGNVKLVTLPSNITFNMSTYEGTTLGAVSRIKEETPQVAVTYQRVPGTLNKMRKYRSANILGMERIRYRGMMNMHDLENLFTDENQKNVYYDLSDVRVVKYVNGAVDEAKAPKDFSMDMVTDRTEEDGLDMSVIKNIHVKYIALPDGMQLPEADKIKANSPELLSMGVMKSVEDTSAETATTTNTFSVYSWENLDADGNQISSVRQITDMYSEAGGDEVVRTNINNVVMKGFFNDKDINCYIHNDGPDYGLAGATVNSLDLSGAIFKNPNDMVLHTAGFSQKEFKKLQLPLHMTEIPAEFMNGLSAVKELYIPEGYETVGTNAFNGTGLSHIYTDKAEGVDIANDNGEGTMTLPSSLKKICTGAFAVNNNTKITDVYVLSLQAPVCELDAFSSAMYFQNNSYNATVPIHQGSYQDYGTYCMTVLHFPKECLENEVNKYTDPTRDYSLGDGLGTTDAEGNLIYWPNQSEFCVAEIQAVCGYTWNSWDIERTGYSTEIANVFQPGGTTGSDIYRNDKEQADGNFAANGSPEGTVFYDADSDNPKLNTDYRGWHQFVLTSYSRGKDADPTFDFGNISDNSWWTICLPFTLTKKDIADIYGDETVVCTLVKVERNYTTNTITLGFGKNLMETDENETVTVGDDDNVILAGYPYMIKPSAAEGKAPADFILSSEKYAPEIPEGDNDGGIHNVLKTDHDIKATKEYGTVDDAFTYKFVGTFAKYYIPTYSYFLAWDGTKPAYFYQSETSAAENRNWNPYTCVVTVNWDNPEWILADPKNNTVAHWNVTMAEGETLATRSMEDSFTTASGADAKNTDMTFGENGTTGINTVHTANGTVDFANGKVYNMNGQLVSEGGNLNSLAKGVYVVNGKKYVNK